MIRGFRSKWLEQLYLSGTTAKIDGRFHERLLRCLDALAEAQSVSDMNIPGYKFHSLKGFSPTRYSVHINGPWCVTFEFHETDALSVDFEQYH